eukprot:PhF_6_TR10826/c0_g1_i1/m.17465/K01768/E4.6.1.1; adenylate cyclase
MDNLLTPPTQREDKHDVTKSGMVVTEIPELPLPLEVENRSAAIEPLNISRRPMCVDQFLSVRVILPTIVFVVMFAMGITTILLLVENTNAVVADVVTSLQHQVTSSVYGRLQSLLESVTTQEKLTARAIDAHGLPPPTDNTSNLVPQYDWLLELLDRVPQNHPLINTHYIFFRTGRVVGVDHVDNVTHLYAEEKEGRGLIFWEYNAGNVSSINMTKDPKFSVPDYVGAQRPYFTSVDHSIPFDYSWTNPYKLGPLLLFTCSMTIGSPQNGFLGVIGADVYLQTLSGYLQSLKPTSGTEIAIADNELFVVAISSGDVLTPDGERIQINDLATPKIVSYAARTTSEEDWMRLKSEELHTSVFIFEESAYLFTTRWFAFMRAQFFIVVVTPENDFLANAQRSTRVTIIICSCIAGGGIFVVLVIAFLIAKALRNLENNLNSVARLEVDAQAATPTLIFSELIATHRSYQALHAALYAFQRYVPVSVVRGVIAGAIRSQLGMGMVKIIAAFQDVDGFTTLCEKYRQNPDLVVDLVSPIFESISVIIQKWRGTIDKYIGDCIMSFWVVQDKNEQESVVNSVSAMFHSLLVKTKEQHHDIRVRTGFHFGEALLGNFGSQHRYNYTVVGDAVNTAARLEPLNKELRTRCLLSDALYSYLPQTHPLQSYIRNMGKMKLAGKADAIRIFELRTLSDTPHFRGKWVEMMESFERGHFEKAQSICEELSDMSTQDDPSLFELSLQIDDVMVHPTSHWEGVRKQRVKN